MRAVYQFLEPRIIERQLRQLHTTQAVLAKLTGVSQTAFCLWFAGERALSLNLQQKIIPALAFLEELQAGSDIALDLTDADALLPRWKKFQRIRLETEVIRADDEPEVCGTDKTVS